MSRVVTARVEWTLRWLARLSAVPVLVVFGLNLGLTITWGWVDETGKPEGLGVGLAFVGMIVGLLASFRWPLLGGVFALVTYALVTYVLGAVHQAWLGPDTVTNLVNTRLWPYFVPAVLFVVHGLAARAISR